MTGPWSNPVTATTLIPAEPNRWARPVPETTIPHGTVRAWWGPDGWHDMETVAL